MAIDPQTSKDLEFDEIRNLLATYCKSTKAKTNALKIGFFSDIIVLQEELDLIEEIQAVYHDKELTFPHPNAEDIDGALKMLRIENGVLILDELIKVFALCIGTKELTKFANTNKTQLPLIYQACAHIDRINDVLKIITEVLDEKKLVIKSSATHKLQELRQKLKSNERESSKNFDRVLQQYRLDGILGDTEETHLDNRRLLTVLSQYKKQVKGKIHGISAKGNFTYIEPQETVESNNLIDQLKIEERHEIYLILEALTVRLRGERNNLKAFQRLLIRFDLLSAKVNLAESYQGIKPTINHDKSLYWKNAKHPLLYLKNQSVNLPTIGQDIALNNDQRFMVISGPNAGGKSITLKTIGLLQMMFQSGLFLPLEHGSSSGWFNQVLSDIGDNQSIENQLSTYSYRLNRMQFFLTQANEDTLLLLDEFGSGSDPELGGALAEVFYKELYEKNLYAVITTHYTNIKILTSSLPEAINACMLFDTKKLQPLYQLSIGQPGSSFTFEVAEFNGIPTNLIEQAKSKVSEQKIKIDSLTVDLQKEKSKFKKINTEQIRSNTIAKKQIAEYEKKLSNLIEKSDRLNQYVEQQNKFVNTGKKIYELIKKFKQHKTNKALNEAIKKMIAIEKSKVLAKSKPVELNQKLKLPQLPKHDSNTELIVEKVEPTIDKVDKPKQTLRKILEIGDLVKLKNQSKAGTIHEIKGKRLKVHIGTFVISTQISEIEQIL